MKNAEDVELLARYLIETNEEEYIFYDEDLKADIHVIKSVLKRLIGNITILDETLIKKEIEELTPVLINVIISLN